jgi:hypothetical protein
LTVEAPVNKAMSELIKLQSALSSHACRKISVQGLKGSTKIRTARLNPRLGACQE